MDMIINGLQIIEKTMTQLWIVRNSKNNMRHLIRLAPIEPNVPVSPICSSSGRGGQRIKGYSIEGCVFESGPGLKVIDINHATDFCQPCKSQLRRLLGIDFTYPVLTTTLSESYLGQPMEQRFIAFSCAHREGAPEEPPPTASILHGRMWEDAYGRARGMSVVVLPGEEPPTWPDESLPLGRRRQRLTSTGLILGV